MARIIGILIVLALAGGTAYALGVGGEGRQFGRMGATAGKSSGAPPPPTCTINGSLNFSGSSSCNMIFYMTGVIQ